MGLLMPDLTLELQALHPDVFTRGLSMHQIQIVEAVCNGLSMNQITEELGLNLNYAISIYEKACKKLRTTDVSELRERVHLKKLKMRSKIAERTPITQDEIDHCRNKGINFPGLMNAVPGSTIGSTAKIRIEPYTYLFDMVGTEWIKIGKSVDVGRRLTQIQHASPFEIQCCAYVDADIELDLFYHCRDVVRRGEWFKTESKFVIDYLIAQNYSLLTL